MAGIGGRRQRRGWRWLAVVGAVLVSLSVGFAAWAAWAGRVSPAEAAGLWGLPVAVAALVVSVLAAQKPPDGADAHRARVWAATLARQVLEGEQRQWRQLLGDDLRRINLTFTVRARSARDARAPTRTGCLFGGTATVLEVAEFYRRTHPRRLVVTGAAGAGKTVLAVELMLALLEQRAPGEPVPVRVSLADWDSAESLSDRLVRHLVHAYDWPGAMAADLVEQGLVLPVLDGLDEMDRHGERCGPRARAAVDELNTYQDGRSAAPLVLTCRSAFYQSLDRRAALADCVHIEIGPVSARAARTFLLERTDDPDRWKPLLKELAADPAGGVATALSTPWRLCLAATVYAREGDPTDLLAHPDPSALREHLLARFIPAAVAQHPGPDHRGYRATDVHRWLARLAAHLGAAATSRETSAATGVGTDLILHQLWPLAGPRRVRAADTLLRALAVMLPLSLVFLAPPSDPQSVPVSPTFTALQWAATAAVLTVGAAGYGALARVRQPRRLDWRHLRTGPGLRRFATGAAIGLGAAIALALLLTAALALTTVLYQPQYSPSFLTQHGLTGAEAPRLSYSLTEALYSVWIGEVILAVVLGIPICLTSGLVHALVGEPNAAAKPRDTIHADLMVDLLLGLLGALAGALGYGGLVLVRGGAAAIFPVPLLMLTFVLGLGAGAGRRYLVFVLCSRGRLPRRLGPFLDWACRAGLLRRAGTAYQFRHRELQQWLMRHPTCELVEPRVIERPTR